MALNPRLVRGVALGLLLFIASIAGILDAAANAQLVPKHVAAVSILGCLLFMLAFLGAASKDHQALAINTLLSIASVPIAHLAFALLVAR